MKYKLKSNLWNPNLTALEYILVNRGIPYEDIDHYLNTTDEDINDYNLLGREKLEKAYNIIKQHGQGNNRILIIVDSDADGYTSAALLYNYLYQAGESLISKNINFYFHEGKQHGLNDCYENIIDKEYYNLIFVPDAGTNDLEAIRALEENGFYTIILDHHEREIEIEDSDNIVIINNQICDYPNKELSGVGVTWQFCRFLDEKLKENYANNFLDLVAVGLIADMMKMTSIETKHLTNKGINQLHNSFIKKMFEKNSFNIGNELTIIGVTFYIAPFINAIVRSGTIEEKVLLFTSMLDINKDKEVDSTKRGHKAGDKENLVDQAVRVVTNVKARQTKVQDNSMELLEKYIKERNLLEHKVILILLEPKEIDANVAGLCANKLMDKYCRPICILFKNEKEENYSGSARGCDKVGITMFKDICQDTRVIEQVVGHQGAFGISILQNNINTFLVITDNILKDMPTEPYYQIDLKCDNSLHWTETVLALGNHKDLWGIGIEEPKVVFENLPITNINLIGMQSGHPTLKLVHNDIEFIQFRYSQEKYDELISHMKNGVLNLTIVGKCAINEWNGRITPQVQIIDFEINETPICFNF